MRVILRNLPEKEITCSSCQSILAYTKKDIHYKDEEYFGDWHYHTYIKCPVCNGKIILEADGVKMI